MAAPVRQLWPIKTGQIGRSTPATSVKLLHCQKQSVEVGLSESALDNLKQFDLFKFVQVAAYASLSRSHIGRERCLTGEACVVTPSVFEQHCISELRADGDISFGQYEIRNLRKAVASNGIRADNFDVPLFENVPDVAVASCIHEHIVHDEILGRPLIPYCACDMSEYSTFVVGWGSGDPSSGASKRCNPPINTLVSRLRSVSSLICKSLVLI